MYNKSMSSTGAIPWKILIADDDEDVHEATRLALRGTVFRGRQLEFIDAYSASETLEKLQQHPDTVIVLLDVIMETDDAGLSAASRIRESGFNLVRIIVRTGFPGQAPERQVIVNYDIHDYKEKSELTVQKLFTSIISALRAYDDLVALENHRSSLMSVLESVSWFDFNAIQRYLGGMLATFSNLTGLNSEQILMVSRPVHRSTSQARVVAALGDWGRYTDISRFEDLPADVRGMVLDTLDNKEAHRSSHAATLFSSSHDIDLVIFAAGSDVFAGSDRVLLDVFMHTVCQALCNQLTFANIRDERNAVFRGLAVQAERWDKDGVENLERLTRLVTATAQRLETTLVFPAEINDCFVRDIGVAAALHDLGNQALPESMLTKAAALSEEERRVMRTHVAHGLALLKEFVPDNKNLAGVSLAQQVIASHHEHFDGGGYPAGLRGEEIPLAARVVAVVDSFTAMTAQRPYREALSDDEACALIKAAAGKQFDPRIVQAFLTVLERD